MVLMIEPISKCIEKLKNEREYDAVIFMTPDGEKLNQKFQMEYLSLNIIILCGRYGVDQRVRDIFVTWKSPLVITFYRGRTTAGM